MKEHEIALRLANIEALLVELLERRRGKVRSGAKRSRSIRERVRAESLASPAQPSERHLEMARRFLAQR